MNPTQVSCLSYAIGDTEAVQYGNPNTTWKDKIAQPEKVIEKLTPGMSIFIGLQTPYKANFDKFLRKREPHNMSMIVSP